MSDPNLNYDQPQEFDRYAYQFAWKDKNSLYQTVVVYAYDLRRAKEKFTKEYSRSMAVDLDRDKVLIDRLPLKDS